MTRSEADQDGVVPDDDDLTLSWHARRRIGELWFAVRDVVDCVRQPEQNYGSNPAYGPDRRTYQRGDLAVVLHELTTKVVTVLLRSYDRWEHGRDHRGAAGQVRAPLLGAVGPRLRPVCAPARLPTKKGVSSPSCPRTSAKLSSRLRRHTWQPHPPGRREAGHGLTRGP